MFQFLRFLGDYGEGETPVPIPNTEVKPFYADGTAWVTVWESRSSPRLKMKARWQQRAFSFFDPVISLQFFKIVIPDLIRNPVSFSLLPGGFSRERATEVRRHLIACRQVDVPQSHA